MNRNFSRNVASWLGALLCLAPNVLMAQTNQTDAARWLAKSDVAPPFAVPSARAAWETQRRQVRDQLWELLGELPPRPKQPKVETLSEETRGDCVVEKFQFDNDAGANNKNCANPAMPTSYAGPLGQAAQPVRATL